MKPICLFFLCFIFFQNFKCVSSQKKNFVKDNARILSEEFIQSLNKKIYENYSNKKVQLIVYTINSIANVKSLEEYTNDLVEKTDFGDDGFAQSVIMILYPDEGSVFLRWGDNLKDRIDMSSVKVVIDSMKIFFEKNDFANGISFGVNQVYSLVK